MFSALACWRLQVPSHLAIHGDLVNGHTLWCLLVIILILVVLIFILHPIHILVLRVLNDRGGLVSNLQFSSNG
jgi:hypothetical protein